LANLAFKYIYISESTSYVILEAKLVFITDVNALQKPSIVDIAISVDI
jgi:hypothetical protein